MSNDDQPALWAEVGEILKSGNHDRGDGPLGSINRLLRKHPLPGSRGIQAPQIQPDGVEIAVEHWDVRSLWDDVLVKPSQVTDDLPRGDASAFILLRWAGLLYLIDGRRRINELHRQQDPGTYRVLVIQHPSDPL
jgi:hypothetical protein